MRSLWKLGLLVVVFALPSVQVMAQFPGGRMMMGRNLLLNKSVQEELKMDKEQIEKADKGSKEIREKLGLNDFAKLGQMKEEERAELGKQVAEEFAKLRKDVLKEGQIQRLTEIELQQKGLFRAVMEKETQSALKLTEKQNEDIKDIFEDASKELKDLSSNLPKFDPTKFGDPKAREEMQKAFQDFQKKSKVITDEATANIEKMMTADQKKTWSKLIGAKFELKEDPRPPRPGGTTEEKK